MALTYPGAQLSRRPSIRLTSRRIDFSPHLFSYTSYASDSDYMLPLKQGFDLVAAVRCAAATKFEISKDLVSGHAAGAKSRYRRSVPGGHDCYSLRQSVSGHM